MDPDLYLAATTGDIDRMMDFEEEKISQVTLEGNHTILHVAAMSNKSISVRAILEEFPYLLDRVNSKNETALHLAARNGYSAVVKVLLKKSSLLQMGDDPRHARTIWEDFIRKGNVDRDTALHLAVRNNHLEVVKLIVIADVWDKHSQNNKLETPLYLAAMKGYKNIIEVILRNSATSPSFIGPEGKTALHAAVIRRSPDCVKALLKGDLVHITDSKGWTALHHAAFHNCVSLLRLLVGTENHQYSDLSEYKQSFNNYPYNKKTALHIAAYEGHIATVLELMTLYPSFVTTLGDEDGRNILHIAADRNHKELVQAILQDCVDIDELLNVKDNDGNTPLHLLVIRGCFVPDLIKHGRVDRNAKNNDNFTPLELLYHDENIVADQLKIKESLADSQHNQGWKFWPARKNKSKLVMKESLVPPSKRSRKDRKFKINKKKLMKDKVGLYRERTNTQIIVTALITTVTFTVGFTMPGGYHQSGETDEGLAVLSKKLAFNVFMVADAVALLLSTFSLFLYFISSVYQDPHQVSKLIATSMWLNIVSVVAMMLTFIMGTYAVLPHSSALAITVLVISCLFFPCVIYLLTRFVCDCEVAEKFEV